MTIPTQKQVIDVLSTRLMQLQSSTDYRSGDGQKAIKQMLAGAWNLLEPTSKRAFMDSLDENLRFDSRIRKTKIDRREEEEALIAKILTSWPSVLPSVGKEDLGFAKSVMKNRGKKYWWPSDAQAARMKALWAERNTSADEDADISLTEDDE